MFLECALVNSLVSIVDAGICDKYQKLKKWFINMCLLEKFCIIFFFVFPCFSVDCVLLCLTNQEIEQLKGDKTELEDRIGGLQERIANQEAELEVSSKYRHSFSGGGTLCWFQSLH